MGTLTVNAAFYSYLSTTDDTTLTGTVNGNAAIGDVILLFIAAANTGASGAARTVTVADNASGTTNVYTQRGTTGNQTGGTAGDGASQYFFECPVTTALTSGVDSITITFSGNVAQKACRGYKLTPAGGEIVQFVEVGTASTGAGATTHSAATVSVTIDHTIFGHAAIETDDAVTGDADTDNGTWTSFLTVAADGGTDANAMSSSQEYKTVTATGNQSWACTTVTGRDSARNYIIYKSAAAATAYPNNMIRSPSIIGVP